MIAIIDYGAGNLRSIQRALEAHGETTMITSDPSALADADAVVLPGVGNAGHAMDQLESMGMADAIRSTVAEKTPFLGICVGMQVLFEHQQEGDRPGLGLLPGRVRVIEGAEKLPHIGWNRSEARTSAHDLNGSSPYFYFVHSFVAEPENAADVAAVSSYGEEFPSVVIRENVWGTQFHPEKSGTDGLDFLGKWVATFREPASPTAE